jgi:hypothetical protein
MAIISPAAPAARRRHDGTATAFFRWLSMAFRYAFAEPAFFTLSSADFRLPDIIDILPYFFFGFHASFSLTYRHSADDSADATMPSLIRRLFH